MSRFSGFPPGKTFLTPLPDVFFQDLLPVIDNLPELKVILYTFWFLNRQQGSARYFTFQDFLQDKRLLEGLTDDPAVAPAVLQTALDRAVAHSVLLQAALLENGEKKTLYFLNTANGRAALKAFQAGHWSPDPNTHVIPALEQESSSIYRLYEENVGPLTPMIADMLRDAEQIYPSEWIREALQIAIENNIRRWRYVEAILKSWQENGRHGTDRQDLEKNRNYYLKGDSANFIEH
ncbi:MAG: DnaD domain protein [Anaerolineaceae bacterium]|nr:DnaD domain protein [Anaerolineaceae bacterium]